MLTLAEIDQATAAEDEVLVKVHAASIPIGDYYTVAGLPYVMRPMFSATRAKNRVPGTDFAGTVEAVGDDVTQFQPDDEVFGS